MALIFQKIILFIISVKLAFSKLETQIEKLMIKNEISKFNNLAENKYYYIQFNSTNLPNYIKLLVKDNYFKTSQSDYIDYMISYYKQDKTFTERNQISYQSFKSKDFIIMWLNKEQIKDAFYLSIETDNSTCNYTFEIYSYAEAELYPSEQYSYYVTKENKEMKFVFTKQNFKLGKNNDYFTVWAKSIMSIETSFSGMRINNSITYHNISAYFIVTDDSDYRCALRIKAKEGDFITIGTLPYKSGFIVDYYYDGIEYYGFLIQNLLLENCIPTTNFEDKSYEFNDYRTYKEIPYTIYQSYPSNIKKACIEIEKNYRYKVLFYFLKTSSTNSQSFYKVYSICSKKDISSKNCYLFQKIAIYFKKFILMKNYQINHN